jgi:hypothetical protein
MGLNLPRSGLVQHPDSEDGSEGFIIFPVFLPASDLERYAEIK